MDTEEQEDKQKSPPLAGMEKNSESNNKEVMKDEERLCQPFRHVAKPKKRPCDAAGDAKSGKKT